MKKFITNSSLETIKIGEQIGKFLNKGDVVLLIGDLSGGKTTLTKGIGKALGVNKIINSPTFTIVKTYKGIKSDLYHLDLYRLNGLNNDFDLEEYIETDGVCVIEWPFQVEELMPNEYISINFKIIGLDEREILVDAVGDRYKKIVGEL